jgi:hypothetical protein
MQLPETVRGIGEEAIERAFKRARCVTDHSKSRKSPVYFAGEVAVISNDAEINESILRNLSGIYS